MKKLFGIVLLALSVQPSLQLYAFGKKNPTKASKQQKNVNIEQTRKRIDAAAANIENISAAPQNIKNMIAVLQELNYDGTPATTELLTDSAKALANTLTYLSEQENINIPLSSQDYQSLIDALLKMLKITYKNDTVKLLTNASNALEGVFSIALEEGACNPSMQTQQIVDALTAVLKTRCSITQDTANMFMQASSALWSLIELSMEKDGRVVILQNQADEIIQALIKVLKTKCPITQDTANMFEQSSGALRILIKLTQEEDAKINLSTHANNIIVDLLKMLTRKCTITEETAEMFTRISATLQDLIAIDQINISQNQVNEIILVLLDRITTICKTKPETVHTIIYTLDKMLLFPAGVLLTLIDLSQKKDSNIHLSSNHVAKIIDVLYIAREFTQQNNLTISQINFERVANALLEYNLLSKEAKQEAENAGLFGLSYRFAQLYR